MQAPGGEGVSRGAEAGTGLGSATTRLRGQAAARGGGADWAGGTAVSAAATGAGAAAEVNKHN